jgi:surface polysaccharide O-acyltransferase-like enzyme
MINKELSDKIKVTSFIATLLVLYRHSLNYLAFFGTWTGFGINKVVQNSAMVFTEMAVPYFFIISGYFFCKKQYNSYLTYKTLVLNKTKTLLIPFILWNLFCLAILFVTNTQVFNHISIQSFIQDLVLSKWDGPLWYVRDLFALMLLIPLYQWIIHSRYVFVRICPLFIIFFFWIPVDSSFISTEAIFFFYMGCLISSKDKLLQYRINKYWLIIPLLFWISYSTGIFLYRNIIIHRLNTLIGLIIVWQAINALPQSIFRYVMKYSSYAFVIYASHSYLVKILKNGIAFFFKNNELIALLTYLFLPFMTAIIIINIAKRWKRYFPTSYHIFTGNR